MSKRRRLTAALTFVAASFAAADAPACWLTDWLHGRQPAYVAGYTPYTAAYPYAAGYGAVPVGYAAASPVMVAPPSATPLYRAGFGATAMAPTPRYQVSGVYRAQLPAYNNPSVYTGMPVTSPTVQTSFSLPTAPAATPLATAYPPASLPIPSGGIPLASRLRGNAPRSSFYGGGNAYPTPPSVPQSYSAGYAAPATTLPATTLPATPTAPLFVAPARPRVGGLGRFFSSLFGTNYRTSYYRAPVTYYRPVTSVDPVSGVTVTSQQACTSYLDQLQRSPYSSLGANQPSVYPSTPIGAPIPAGAATFNPQLGTVGDSAPISPPSLSGGQPASAYSPPSANGSVMSQYPPTTIGGVNQASATFDSPNQFSHNQFTVPIPTTVAPSGTLYGSPGTNGSAPPSPSPPPSSAPPNHLTPGANHGAGDHGAANHGGGGSTPPRGTPPNTEPLSGAPATTNQDRSPLAPPQLDAARPEQTAPAEDYRSDIDRYLDDNRDNSDRGASEPPKTKTQWRLQNPADSSVFGSKRADSADRMIAVTEQSEPSQGGYSSVRPIQAPPEYTSPFQRRTLEVQPRPSERERSLTAPPLPPRSEHSANAASRERGRDSIRVREAALVRQRAVVESARQRPEHRAFQAETRPSETGQPERRPPRKRKRQESGWGAIGS